MSQTFQFPPSPRGQVSSPEPPKPRARPAWVIGKVILFPPTYKTRDTWKNGWFSMVFFSTGLPGELGTLLRS